MVLVVLSKYNNNVLSSYRALPFTLKQATKIEVLPLKNNVAFCNFCFLFFLLLMTRVKRILCPGCISR